EDTRGPGWRASNKRASGGGSVPPVDYAVHQLGERNEIDDGAAINIGARHGDGTIRGDLLGHLQDVLGSRRANWDHHDPVVLQLMQERWRDVVDAAGDDDLVERRLFRPAVVAVRIFGGDRLVLAITALDQRIVELPRPFEERLDDLDRPDLVGE